MNAGQGRAVVVTGANRGIGAVIAKRLAEDGFTVFAGARHPDPSLDPRIVSLELDVTDRPSLEAAAAIVDHEVGARGLHALINNAAVLEAGSLSTADEGQIDRHFRSNVAGPLATVQTFLPALIRGGGRIVNVSSINAQLPMPMWGLYSASKAALVALSDVLRFELSERGVNVTVLTLGAFATDIRRRSLAGSTAVDPDANLVGAVRRLVDVLDAAAEDPIIVAEAVVEVLLSDQPVAHRSVGAGVDGLLALAAEPPEVRDAALRELLGSVMAS